MCSLEALAMVLVENRRLARRIPEEVATGGNVDLMDDIVSEDFMEHGFFGETVRGREAAKNRIRELIGAFPDLEADVKDVVAEDDMVAMRVMLRGTHDGEFIGFEPSGKFFEVQNIVITRIENGRIVERWVQADTLSMLAQLGIVDMPGKLKSIPNGK